jgi:hypothetical protein
MLMETNGGLVEFAAANTTSFPVSNSLMYSIYKCYLTILTDCVLENKTFKATTFIDDHYNYHTAQDDINHLDKNTLAHQGTYLMPLLKYFSNADLNKIR